MLDMHREDVPKFRTPKIREGPFRILSKDGAGFFRALPGNKEVGQQIDIGNDHSRHG